MAAAMTNPTIEGRPRRRPFPRDAGPANGTAREAALGRKGGGAVANPASCRKGRSPRVDAPWWGATRGRWAPSQCVVSRDFADRFAPTTLFHHRSRRTWHPPSMGPSLFHRG